MGSARTGDGMASTSLKQWLTARLGLGADKITVRTPEGREGQDLELPEPTPVILVGTARSGGALQVPLAGGLRLNMKDADSWGEIKRTSIILVPGTLTGHNGPAAGKEWWVTLIGMQHNDVGQTPTVALNFVPTDTDGGAVFPGGNLIYVATLASGTTRSWPIWKLSDDAICHTWLLVREEDQLQASISALTAAKTCIVNIWYRERSVPV